MNAQTEFQITLQVQPSSLAVCQLVPTTTLPSWLTFEPSKFTSITFTSEELSIVCDQTLVPSNVKAQRNWRMLKIKGQLDFALVGILKRVISPLAENGISIYAISTYDTDYILIQESHFEKAIEILKPLFLIENSG